jgi:serine/threonine protein kinase
VIAGRYSLEREIGRGGSGVVWLGRDEVLGRQVALKRIGLLPGADTTDLARAEREARLSAQLNHRHVVGVFDVVVDAESDAHWLVMEYVDGVTLGQLVRLEGPLSPDEAAPFLWQAADALVAAHRAGIAHRDVKPSNILVDRDRQAKLTDFGIARIATDATLTQTGMVTGSPAYLAPEVATGGRGDEAADVWSLGATAFHLLAGRPPYEIGDHVLSAMYRIVNEEPPRLPDAGWMAPLLEGTMVRDPSRRWTMTQVRDFLADSQHRVPADGTRPLAVAAPLTGSPRRRGPGKGVLIVCLGLLVVVVLVGVLYAVVLNADDPSSTGSASGPSGKPSASATTRGPTEAGMKSFIRDYVAAVSTDPARSWQMLTPKFQVESGGFEKYDAFWGPATNGRVLSVSANPDNLSVSYQVHFDDFDNGPGPTVLDLTFEDGRYLIDGERTQGFTPAG